MTGCHPFLHLLSTCDWLGAAQHAGSRNNHPLQFWCSVDPVQSSCVVLEGWFLFKFASFPFFSLNWMFCCSACLKELEAILFCDRSVVARLTF